MSASYALQEPAVEDSNGQSTYPPQDNVSKENKIEFVSRRSCGEREWKRVAMEAG